MGCSITPSIGAVIGLITEVLVRLCLCGSSFTGLLQPRDGIFQCSPPWIQVYGAPDVPWVLRRTSFIAFGHALCLFSVGDGGNLLAEAAGNATARIVSSLHMLLWLNHSHLIGNVLRSSSTCLKLSYAGKSRRTKMGTTWLINWRVLTESYASPGLDNCLGKEW